MTHLILSSEYRSLVVLVPFLLAVVLVYISYFTKKERKPFSCVGLFLILDFLFVMSLLYSRLVY